MAVDYFFFHQANGKMLRVIAHNLMRLYAISDASMHTKIPSKHCHSLQTPLLPQFPPFSTHSEKQSNGRISS